MRAALVASCLRGALPPVDLRAVCLVRAMVDLVWVMRLLVTFTARSCFQPGSSGRRAHPPRTPAPRPPHHATPASPRRPQPALGVDRMAGDQHGGSAPGERHLPALRIAAPRSRRCTPAGGSLRRLLLARWLAVAVGPRHEPIVYELSIIVLGKAEAAADRPLCHRRPAKRWVPNTPTGRTASCARRLPRRGHRQRGVRIKGRAVSSVLRRRARPRVARLRPPAACRRPVEGARLCSRPAAKQQRGWPTALEQWI